MSRVETLAAVLAAHENTRVASEGYRVCRTCHREQARRAYHARTTEQAS